MSSPASADAAPKIRNGAPPALPSLRAPASAMKGATMPPTRAAWLTAPRTAERMSLCFARVLFCRKGHW
jgi:hypothetical protein